MKNPRISIILPTYNGARFLPRAIASVQAQDFADWELLVVDDGSTDTTLTVAEAHAAADPRIRVLPNGTNQGIQKSLNKGLREARGEYVARIDDDDTWVSPSKLSRQVAFLGVHPTCVLIGTGIVVSDEDGNETMRYFSPVTDVEIRARMLFKNCFVHSSIMMRRDVAIRLGGYEEGLAVRHVEDYALWLTMGTAGTMHNLRSYDTGFTARAGGLSGTNKRAQLRRALSLITRYRCAYPGYYVAYGMVMVKICAYSLFMMLPARIQNILFARYKSW